MNKRTLAELCVDEREQRRRDQYQPDNPDYKPHHLDSYPWYLVFAGLARRLVGQKINNSNPTTTIRPMSNMIPVTLPRDFSTLSTLWGFAAKNLSSVVSSSQAD